MSDISCSSASSASAGSLPQVALIATGGTIAGVAPTPLEQISYQAGVLSVECMLESLPGIDGVARIASREDKPFFQEEFCQVGAVLAGYASDESDFWGVLHAVYAHSF